MQAVLSNLKQLLLELVAVAALLEAVMVAVLLVVVVVEVVVILHWMPMLIYKLVWIIYGVNKLTDTHNDWQTAQCLWSFYPHFFIF